MFPRRCRSACGSLARIDGRVARPDDVAEFRLPAIDGVVAAVKLVEAVIGLGLGTSKAIGYAPPLPKRYVGDLARFAP